jgi:hypothetical protein
MQPQINPRTSPSARSKNGRHRLKIAWAITIAEFILFAGAVAVFHEYWMMLPVPYRIAGVAGLALIAALGIFRLARLYVKRDSR